MSVESWLEKNTSYTQKEKEDLKRTHEESPRIHKKHTYCKCFCKAETYIEVKHARPIKSRTDRWKTEVGPAFQAVNEMLFKHRAFVKKIPLDERPAYLKKILKETGIDIDCTDFSSFEAHFIRCIMLTCEFVMFSWILHRHPIHDDFMMKIEKVHASAQRFIFKYFTTSVWATRASGEMCTSSGNGCSNYLVFKYIARTKGARTAEGGHEGDDGITQTTPAQSKPTAAGS